MAEEFKLKVKSKDTIIKCLKVENSNAYEDTIIKHFTYDNHNSLSLIVTNICNTSFVLPMQVLFEQQDNLGSTFKASINSTPVPAGQTVQVPVYYNGKYRGLDNNPLYFFIMNGQSVQYKLIVVNNDTIGTIEDFTIEKDSRVDHVFTADDFLLHYNDPDVGDTITHVMFFVNVNSIRYNNISYVEGAEISLADVQLGKLKRLAPQVDTLAEEELFYKVKDSNNNIID